MRGIGAAFGVLGLLIVVGIIGYLAVGIGGSPSSPGAGTSADGGTAPGTGQAPRSGNIGRLLDAQDNVRLQSALASVRQRITAYKALNGSFPASLDALAAKDGQPLPGLPDGMRWTYDAGTGDVDAK
jgi:hypothetical protein